MAAKWRGDRCTAINRYSQLIKAIDYMRVCLWISELCVTNKGVFAANSLEYTDNRTQAKKEGGGEGRRRLERDDSIGTPSSRCVRSE